MSKTITPEQLEDILKEHAPFVRVWKAPDGQRLDVQGGSVSLIGLADRINAHFADTGFITGSGTPDPKWFSGDPQPVPYEFQYSAELKQPVNSDLIGKTFKDCVPVPEQTTEHFFHPSVVALNDKETMTVLRDLRRRISALEKK